MVDLYKILKYTNFINLIQKTYQEWWRDWPYEAQQPMYSSFTIYKVLIPAVFITER